MHFFRIVPSQYHPSDKAKDQTKSASKVKRQRLGGIDADSVIYMPPRDSGISGGGGGGGGGDELHLLSNADEFPAWLRRYGLAPRQHSESGAAGLSAARPRHSVRRTTATCGPLLVYASRRIVSTA